jgi:hypothetical protein
VDSERLRELLEAVASGEAGVDDALRRLESAPFEDLGFARVDHHRAVREGLPEVILGLGKTPAQVARIAAAVFERAGRVLVTRIDEPQLAALGHALPGIEHDPQARLAWADSAPRDPTGHVAIVCAGTADIPVAEEAAITATMIGAQVSRHYDVGVAGIHRLLARVETLRDANAIVVAAGMEGALPSVVGGLVATPVIAVPTSIGYGASFGGLAALLAMLNSCATGVSVVNIDNGFGAGYLAATINALAVGSPSSRQHQSPERQRRGQGEGAVP